MKHASTLFLGAFAAISLSCSEGLNDSEHILCYDEPAKVWQEMLPVGNGRMGMMTDGDPAEEHIILNEISLWSGSEVDYANPDAAESLPVIRQALLEGRNAEAQKIMYERFVPKKDTDGGTYGTYQVLGQLIMRHGYEEQGAAAEEPGAAVEEQATAAEEPGAAVEEQATAAEEPGAAGGKGAAEKPAGTEDYRRWLDLREATSYTDYRIGGVEYQKKYYVSRTDDVMIVEVRASEAGRINLEVELDRAGRAAEELTSEGLLKFWGNLDSGTEALGMGYCAYAKVATEGQGCTIEYMTSGKSCSEEGESGSEEGESCSEEGESDSEEGESCSEEGKSGGRDNNPCIRVCNADRVWIIISAATDYFTEDYEAVALAKLEAVSPSRSEAGDRRAQEAGDNSRLKAAHKNAVKAHQELYLRNILSLAGSGTQTAKTTDRRIVDYAAAGENMAQGANDNALAALYYNYGRYLLICSTQPGLLPPNLQGLWSNSFHTPWNGDYHTNINVQMNHWIAESGNLSELHEPLIDLVMRLIPSGEKSAKDFYGQEAEGWVQHMMTNVWNYTAPGEHPSWGATNTGGAWLCAHLWEHYLYNGDLDYLRKVYPALKGASEFFLSTMITEPSHGWLVTAPTSSPENSFIVNGPEGETAVSICMGPTMDNQLIRELFTNTAAAADLLYPKSETPAQAEQAFATRLREAIAKLPPHQISEEGYLMEWLEDYKEAEPQHRHVSHLYGLYPGNQISPAQTPELAEACKVTLNRRGDEATGWSRAWKINFWARLGDGDRALKLFRSLLAPAAYVDSAIDYRNGAGTYPNLLCAHPPFQIDGNFGGAAGISEMLVQSNEGFINILPALPKEWSEGRIKGLKVRGGATIDLEWSEGKARKITITGGWKEDIKLRIQNDLWLELNLAKGHKKSIKLD